MKAYYDLHIHSCLSPCSEDEMTLNNIVNMSYIKGLDIISITDHNSIQNVEVAIELGKKLNILVVPGIEVQTKEDVHVLGYFKNISDLNSFYNIIEPQILKIPNKKKILGNQYIMDESDNLVREVEYSLLMSVNMSIDEIAAEIRNHRGFFMPAHVDKSSNSLLANLGFIPPGLNIKAVEIYKRQEDTSMYDKYIKMFNSDAHRLTDISEQENYMEIEECSIEGLFNYLKEVK